MNKRITTREEAGNYLAQYDDILQQLTTVTTEEEFKALKQTLMLRGLNATALDECMRRISKLRKEIAETDLGKKLQAELRNIGMIKIQRYKITGQLTGILAPALNRKRSEEAQNKIKGALTVFNAMDGEK